MILRSIFQVLPLLPLISSFAPRVTPSRRKNVLKASVNGEVFALTILLSSTAHSLIPSTTAPPSLPSAPTTSYSRHTSVSLSNTLSSPFLASPSIPSLALSQVPPSQADIAKLQKALAKVYDPSPDPASALPLLTEVIEIWESTSQPAFEVASLLRVKADCSLSLQLADSAYADYTSAIEVFKDSGPQALSELELASLGRARSTRLPSYTLPPNLTQSASDYRLALILSSRSDSDADSETERLKDGFTRNPFAAWEYASTLRDSDHLSDASEAFVKASEAFESIGDHPRSVLSSLDAGVTSASESRVSEDALKYLRDVISSTTTVEGTDTYLLQSVIAKECEARVALASVLWNQDRKPEAERELGEACERMTVLEADVVKRQAKPKGIQPRYTLDGSRPDPGEFSCARFKKREFLRQLGWPESLIIKAGKLLSVKA
ncbi:hypothetical protein TrST_g7946 [Triparma strigata]|uniref:Uncharacterized protein n=1 Tax=Triparma strigata TaxID=1606541 RepID=A0A9W7BMC6_9STRA|nr:hypothetical protein TrST_g7946 [Triparma strigata]